MQTVWTLSVEQAEACPGRSFPGAYESRKHQTGGSSANESTRHATIPTFGRQQANGSQSADDVVIPRLVSAGCRLVHMTENLEIVSSFKNWKHVALIQAVTPLLMAQDIRDKKKKIFSKQYCSQTQFQNQQPSAVPS